MPIINDDEDQFRNKETPVGGGTSYIGGGAATAGNMSTQAPTAPSSDNRSPGTGFVNIGNYLANNNGDRMASDVANKSRVMGGSAMNKIDSWQSGATNDPGNATGYSDTTGYGDVAGSVGGVNQFTKNMGTPSGLQAITGNQGAGGALDAAVMGRGRAGDIVRNAQSDWSGINNYLGQAQNKVNFGIGQKQVQRGVDEANAKKDVYTKQVNDAAAKAAEEKAALEKIPGGKSFSPTNIVSMPQAQPRTLSAQPAGAVNSDTVANKFSNRFADNLTPMPRVPGMTMDYNSETPKTEGDRVVRDIADMAGPNPFLGLSGGVDFAERATMPTQWVIPKGQNSFSDANKPFKKLLGGLK